VKILPKVRSKQTPERTLKKLEREVSLMAKVSRESAGVTQLIDVYEDAKYVYIVMGLNDGGDLEAVLEVRHSVYAVLKVSLVFGMHKKLFVVHCSTCRSLGVCCRHMVHSQREELLL
jgi:serine/threonine protein kinase